MELGRIGMYNFGTPHRRSRAALHLIAAGLFVAGCGEADAGAGREREGSVAAAGAGGAGGSQVSVTGAGAGTTAVGATGGGEPAGAGGGPTCGDGVVQAPEPCDGDALGDSSCGELGFDGGQVVCTEQCTLDVSGCTYPIWGSMFVSEGILHHDTARFFASAGASFAAPDDYAAPVETIGECRRYLYTVGVATTYLAGGVVTITGTEVGSITASPVPFMYGHYYDTGIDWPSVTDLHAPGDVIGFSSSGGAGIPAFSGQVAAPSPVEVTQPSGFATLTTLPAGDFTLAWSGPFADVATISVQSSSTGASHVITCTGPDTGSRTVPAGLMQDLPPNPVSIGVTVNRSSRHVLSKDGKSVQIFASAYRGRGFNP